MDHSVPALRLSNSASDAVGDDTMLSLRTFRRRLGLTLGILLGLLAAGCDSPSVLLPASPQAQAIYDLLLLLFAVSVVVFVVVEGLLIYAVIRFSRRPGKGEVTAHTRRLELAWTAAPAITLAVIFLIMGAVMWFLTTPDAELRGVPTSPTGKEIQVRVVGHQWWWEFEYPDLGIRTATDMHVPIGLLAVLSVESDDVIHSFWVPQLSGKIDAVPGQTNKAIFSATKAGIYRGQCSEFCGVQHAQMLFWIAADSPAQFEAWAKHQQALPPPMTGQAAKGQDVFLTAGCSGCHNVNGSEAMGKFGPDLTHIAGRSALAGGMLKNNPESVARWLTDPQKVKRGNFMPNLNLSPEQVSDLVEYLENLK
jgi:cytochrome c oxidase subunit II